METSRNGLLQASRNPITFRIDNAYHSGVDRRRALCRQSTRSRAHRAPQANTDSFFLTNITLQLDEFNRSFLHELYLAAVQDV